MRLYSKRFAASVTGFARRYGRDPFVRSEINIVVLQFAFALFLLAVVGLIATQLYHDASAAVARGMAAALTTDSSPAAIGTSVVSELDYTRSRTVLYAGAAVILITMLFTYIITRLALAPTRNALESQKRFIGNIAHELRTPLSIIKTNTEVRLLDSGIPPDVVALHRDNLEELDRISGIINNLLSLSASVRPERMEFRNVDMGVVIEQAMAKLRGMTEHKQIELEVHVGEPRVVWGNVAALEQIVTNIAKNAVSYTPKGGHVRVSLEAAQPEGIEFTVRDSGIGIAAKDLLHIFEPYYRTDPSRKRREGGSGLGLTIVHELVKLHHGKITVRSAEKQGTSVSVLLPRGKTDTDQHDAGKKGVAAGEVAVDFSGEAHKKRTFRRRS